MSGQYSTSIRKSSDSIVSLIATHNKRLRCLFDKILKAKSQKIHRFKNCAILRLAIQKINSENVDLSLSFSLVYDGEIGEDEDKPSYIYYISHKDTQQNEGNKSVLAPVATISGNLSKYYTDFGLLDEIQSGGGRYKEIILTDFAKEGLFEDIKKLLYPEITSLDNFKEGKTYVFYLVRHGQGEHNILSTWEQIKKKTGIERKPDTNLTQNGINQAINAGKALSAILANRNEQINYFFVSDLQRTRQTLFNIYANLADNVYVKSGHNQINAYVLACAHEVNKCDEEPDDSNPENEVLSSKFINETHIENKDKKMNIIKTQYFDFYKEKGTDSTYHQHRYYKHLKYKIKKSVCNEYNMIENAINIINETVQNIQTYGTLKNRNSVALTSSRKKKKITRGPPPPLPTPRTRR